LFKNAHTAAPKIEINVETSTKIPGPEKEEYANTSPALAMEQTTPHTATTDELDEPDELEVDVSPGE
jgi:hypothetical protein